MKKGICISATNLMKPDFDYKAIKNSGVEFVNLDYLAIDQNGNIGAIVNAHETLLGLCKEGISSCLSIYFKLNSLESAERARDNLISFLRNLKSYPIILDFSNGTYSKFLDLGDDVCANCIKTIYDGLVSNGFVVIVKSTSGLLNDYINNDIIANCLYYSTSGEPACRATNMEDVKVINALNPFGSFVTTEPQAGILHGTKVYKVEMYTDLFAKVNKNQNTETNSKPENKPENKEDDIKNDNINTDIILPNNEIINKIIVEKKALFNEVNSVIDTSLSNTLNKIKALREALKEI